MSSFVFFADLEKCRMEHIEEPKIKTFNDSLYFDDIVVLFVIQSLTNQ